MFTFYAGGLLSVSAMSKAAEDTKPIGALLTEDGPPPQLAQPTPPLKPGIITPPWPTGTKTFGTGVEETRPKGPDKSPDDSAADPDQD
jgi:hypothetical protein